jgi:hypothetical protein
MSQLPPDLQASLPVDAQGVTQAIDHFASAAAGLSDGERRALIRPHAVNPAVLHARVFGRAPLAAASPRAALLTPARLGRIRLLLVDADRLGREDQHFV